MFSGIIQSTIKAGKIEKKDKSMILSFPIPKEWELKVGESINIDGVCSTITEIKNKSFSVFYMPETVKKTSLAALPKDHIFNLERSLTLSDLVGGHLVSGHVDTTGIVQSMIKEGGSVVLHFILPEAFARYLIYKGSVAINGVSLTVISANNKGFSISLIPHTLSHTNLGKLKRGDSVNIEVDMIAKYVEKLIPNTIN